MSRDVWLLKSNQSSVGKYFLSWYVLEWTQYFLHVFLLPCEWHVWSHNMTQLELWNYVGLDWNSRSATHLSCESKITSTLKNLHISNLQGRDYNINLQKYCITALGFSWETKPIGYICVYLYVCMYIHIQTYINPHTHTQKYIYKIYHKELSHTIMEVEKSQDLQLDSWRPKRATGVVPVGVQKPENQKYQWY